jgi:hypothetical protein
MSTHEFKQPIRVRRISHAAYVSQQGRKRWQEPFWRFFGASLGANRAFPTQAADHLVGPGRGAERVPTLHTAAHGGQLRFRLLGVDVLHPPRPARPEGLEPVFSPQMPKRTSPLGAKHGFGLFRSQKPRGQGTGAILFGPVIAHRVAAEETGGKPDVRARPGTVGMAGGAGNSDRQAVRKNGRHATSFRSRWARLGAQRW